MARMISCDSPPILGVQHHEDGGRGARGADEEAFSSRRYIVPAATHDGVLRRTEDRYAWHYHYSWACSLFLSFPSVPPLYQRHYCRCISRHGPPSQRILHVYRCSPRLLFNASTPACIHSSCLRRQHHRHHHRHRRRHPY